MPQCTNCGAEIQDNIVCSYCEEVNDTDLEYLELDDIAHSHSDEICPFCTVTFNNISLAGEAIQRCPSCFNKRLSVPQLEKIINKTIPFVKVVRSKVQELHLKNKTTILSQRIQCPDCTTFMEPRSLRKGSPVVFYTCPNSHPIIIENGEITEAILWCKFGGRELYTSQSYPLHNTAQIQISRKEEWFKPKSEEHTKMMKKGGYILLSIGFVLFCGFLLFYNSIVQDIKHHDLIIKKLPYYAEEPLLKDTADYFLKKMHRNIAITDDSKATVKAFYDSLVSDSEWVIEKESHEFYMLKDKKAWFIVVFPTKSQPFLSYYMVYAPMRDVEMDISRTTKKFYHLNPTSRYGY